MSQEPVMLWCDVETTGLDPIHDVMLEVGIRLTDVAGNKIAERTELVWTPDWRGRLVKNEFVFNMHDKSGLIHDLEDLSRNDLRVLNIRETVSRRTASWIKEQLDKLDIKIGTLPMCGNSVALDKFFMQFNTPELLACWHYRVIDVSSTREQVRIINRPLFDRIPEDAPKAHRPQGDIDASIKLWTWLVDNAFWTEGE